MNLLANLKEMKNYFFKKEIFFYLTIILIIFFLDRISKREIISNFNESVYFVNDYINFDLIWNIGIGFGFLSTDSSILYNSITVLIGIVILFLFYVLISSEKIDKIIYSIIIGGALGNYYDRLVYKAVPDFIDLHYNNFHWFTFNVADISISIGIIVLLIYGLLKKN